MATARRTPTLPVVTTPNSMTDTTTAVQLDNSDTDTTSDVSSVSSPDPNTSTPDAVSSDSTPSDAVSSDLSSGQVQLVLLAVSLLLQAAGISSPHVNTVIQSLDS